RSTGANAQRKRARRSAQGSTPGSGQRAQASGQRSDVARGRAAQPRGGSMPGHGGHQRSYSTSTPRAGASSAPTGNARRTGRRAQGGWLSASPERIKVHYPERMTLAVRRATVDDADALGVVHVQAWRETYAHLLSPGLLESVSVERRA